MLVGVAEGLEGAGHAVEPDLARDQRCHGELPLRDGAQGAEEALTGVLRMQLEDRLADLPDGPVQVVE